ncbi:MAG: hypothetical protein ACI9FZ_001260 [Bacteroidia bacterium]|jgi:hypothetical protein
MILASFLAFTVFAAVLTYFITRNSDKASSTGFFLGGRSLTDLPNYRRFFVAYEFIDRADGWFEWSCI